MEPGSPRSKNAKFNNKPFEYYKEEQQYGSGKSDSELESNVVSFGESSNVESNMSSGPQGSGEEWRMDMQTIAKELPQDSDLKTLDENLESTDVTMTNASNTSLRSPGISSDDILPDVPRAISPVGSLGSVPDVLGNISFTSGSTNTSASADYTEESADYTTESADGYQPEVQTGRVQGIVEVATRKHGSKLQLGLCLEIDMKDLEQTRKESGADGKTTRRAGDGNEQSTKHLYPSQRPGECELCGATYSRQYYLRKHQLKCKGIKTS